MGGIENNDCAAALAASVLGIGHLQWHIRSVGNISMPEPVSPMTGTSSTALRGWRKTASSQCWKRVARW